MSEFLYKLTSLLALPDGMRVLNTGVPVERGDFWLRPTDGVWIETGTAHWGLRAGFAEYARRKEDC